MIAEARLAAFRSRLGELGVEAALVTSADNMRYLTGFDGVFDEGISGACVVASRFARFHTDFRYAEAARAAAAGTSWEVAVETTSLLAAVSGRLDDDGIGSLAVESSMPHRRFTSVDQRVSAEVVAVDDLVETLRQVKEPDEVAAIQSAAALADQAFDAVLGTLRAGLREVDVALELESFMRRAGSEGVAFPTIVASGPNSARPHAGATMREIAPGEFVKMDFGARIQGYCSDMTRTVVVGVATDRQREVYAAVLAANEAALEGARAGMLGREIDAIARDVLIAAGFGEFFGHGLGHGVGLAVHELPGVGSTSSDVVTAGSVITIEPGVYLTGFGGVRIEDLVLVEENGVRLMSHAPKQLIEI